MIVTSSAPIRVCDCGGWTDTWFARHGRVLNIAVAPRAHVRIDVFPAGGNRPRVLVETQAFGDRYVPPLDGTWSRHPLLEAAIEHVGVPEDLAVEIGIACDVPPGASTGTSAAVLVALVAALHRVRSSTPPPLDIARAAHAIETGRLHQQSGVQDQIAAAIGGVNDIDITDYPNASVRQIPMTDRACRDLERRLALVYLGRGHVSSEIHERVIARLQGLGPACAELERLRQAAAEAIRSIETGDLDLLGGAMSRNTEAQRALHPDLVCADADRVIEIARRHGAAGWKVNGAGGDGGSLTLLGPPDEEDNRRMIAAILAECPECRQIPIALSAGGVRTDSA